VRKMKKYKDSKEEWSVYYFSADLFLACLSIYLRPNRQFKYRELYYAGSPCGDILRPQHALPSDPFLALLPEHFRRSQRILQLVYKPGILAPPP